MHSSIDPDKLEFVKLEDHDLSVLDCTEDDGSDPLDVQRFVRENARIFQGANLTTVYIVKYEQEIVACFSASMSAINVERLSKDEKVQEAEFKSYPAMLLGQMCVDKKYRRHKIGLYLCKFAVGLAQELSNRVACRYVILHTSRDKVRFYERNEFILAETQPIDGKLLMCRRINTIRLSEQ